MLNKVMLIGRLGQDPELKYTQSGMPMTNLNVATDESYTDKDGNRVEKTEWHRVVVFQKQAQNCANYLGKGSLVYVEGSLQTRKWQDPQGQDRYSTEIKAMRVQFLDRRGEARGQAPQGSYDAGPPQYQNAGRRPQQPQYQNRRPPASEDLGSPFPSEAANNYPPEGSNMDEVPF